MANISYRIGMSAPTEQIQEVLKKNNKATASFEKIKEHLLANDINLEKTPLTLGPWLTMDIEKEKFIGDCSFEANMFLSRNYREPFVVREKI